MTGEPVIRLSFLLLGAGRKSATRHGVGRNYGAMLNYFPKITVLEKCELAAI
jgi:hypothetical protein